MLFGKGLFGGTQSQLNFLPENHTDFIFAVVGEELGFIGVTFLLLLYLIVLWRGVVTARDAGDTFSRLLATGITSCWRHHVLINVGMTMGIMPVTGIPLPLMSYGVSSLTTNIMSIAIPAHIRQRKQKLLSFRWQKAQAFPVSVRGFLNTEKSINGATRTQCCSPS